MTVCLYSNANVKIFNGAEVLTFTNLGAASIEASNVAIIIDDH